MLLVWILSHTSVHLGCQDNFIASASSLSQPATDNMLGDPFSNLPTVDISRIEEVYSFFKGLVHDRIAIGLVCVRSKVHRP